MIVATLTSGWNQFKQHFSVSAGSVTTGDIIVAESMAWNSVGNHTSTKVSNWITVPVNTTNATSISVNSNYWQSNYYNSPQGASKSDSWKVNVPAY